MSTPLTLAKKFESFAADADKLSQQAAAIASTVPVDKAEIATGISNVARAMAEIATDLTKALDSARSKPRSKAA